MGNGSEAIVVLVTAPSADKAAEIGRDVVEARLAACANVLGSIRSIYRWQGRVEDEPEALMILKTERACFEALRARIDELHPYTCPEVIALPIEQGHAPYLDWIAASVSTPGPD